MPTEMPKEVDNSPRDDKAWLEWADQTCAGARRLWYDSDTNLWFPAAVLAHQALEMYLKAALIRKGHRVEKGDVWGHDLIELSGKLSSEVTASEADFDSVELCDGLGLFTSYFNELRYPGEIIYVRRLGEEERKLLEELVETLRPLAGGGKT